MEAGNMTSFCAATTKDGCLRRHLGGHLPAFHGSSLRLFKIFRHETGLLLQTLCRWEVLRDLVRDFWTSDTALCPLCDF